jgi:hypothetical protein
MNRILFTGLQWWNLLFWVPIALAVLLLLLSAVTGLGDGESEAEPTPDALEAEGNSESEAEGSSGLNEILRSFGVGVVPVSLLLQCFLLFFGVCGLAANRFVDVASHPEWRVGVSLLVALVGGGAATGGFGTLGRRFFPAEEAAMSGKDLLARSGRVVFTVTEQEGTVQVRDAGGTLHQVAAFVAPGSVPLPTGSLVLLLARNEQTGRFLVEESPFAE